MAGQFASMRKLPKAQHEAATRLVAEVMASMAIQALTEPQTVLATLQAADQSRPSTEAFLEQASDFLDIRGDLVEWAVSSTN